MTTVLEGGEGSGSRRGHFLHQGETLYPLYRRLGGAQGRSGQVRKISPPPGFDPRTVQSVASRYTDYATRPFMFRSTVRNLEHRTLPYVSKPNFCIVWATDIRTVPRHSYMKSFLSKIRINFFWKLSKVGCCCCFCSSTKYLILRRCCLEFFFKISLYTKKKN
jgi:hypothetical protein